MSSRRTNDAGDIIAQLDDLERQAADEGETTDLLYRRHDLEHALARVDRHTLAARKRGTYTRVTSDGYFVLFHGTTRAAARMIRKGAFWAETYFAEDEEDARHYAKIMASAKDEPVVLEVLVPPEAVEKNAGADAAHWLSHEEIPFRQADSEP